MIDNRQETGTRAVLRKLGSGSGVVGSFGYYLALRLCVLKLPVVFMVLLVRSFT